MADAESRDLAQMRILYVITSAEFGGAPLHVLQLARYMLKQSHEVGIVTAPEPRMMQEAKALGVRIFPNPHFVRPVVLWKDFRALWRVSQAIQQFKPDLVSAHSTKAGFAARFSCAILRVPVIFTAHGWAFTEGKSPLSRYFLALAEGLASKVTKKIICVSEHDKELAIRLHVASEKKVKVIHNGMEPSLYLNTDGSKIRSELGLSESEILITMVARFVPQKDHDTLFRALNFLPECGFKVALVGNGEREVLFRREAEKQSVNGRVVFLGERCDVPQILAASGIFVLSSHWEGLPRSIIEAMMSGLPVVATRVGGVPELVEDGVTGFLVPPKDPQALAKALQRLLDDPELRHRMGQLGREKALREFTLDRMLRETEKVYEEVLGNLK
jgi:glycosyltransferase involved in cell wall biosynthesis